MTEKGRLIVFSAPSGCGKGTMLRHILKKEGFRCSVSATTRQPRRDEKDGENYYFITREEFEKKISENAFLEYAEYCGNFYGTLLSEVDDYIEKGINVILEIEVQGAMKIREKRPDALFIFIAPPSVKELRRRLKKRNTETNEVIEKRIAEASGEIAKSVNYDYIIVNDELQDAVNDFFAVVRAETLKTENSAESVKKILSE